MVSLVLVPHCQALSNRINEPNSKEWVDLMVAILAAHHKNSGEDLDTCKQKFGKFADLVFNT